MGGPAFSSFDGENDLQAFNSSNDWSTHKSKTFYFIRHGKTEWNMDMVHLGPQDLDLNESGQSYSKNLASFFKDTPINDPERPKLIFSSRLKRCIQTSEILNNELNIFSLGSSPSLVEIYRGDWSRLSKEESEKASGHLWRKEYLEYEAIVKDCEKWDDFNKRVDDGMFRLLTYVSGCPILVSHGQFIKTFLKQRSCWGEDWTAAWKGDDRPPIKVVVNDESVFCASIMESKNAK